MEEKGDWSQTDITKVTDDTLDLWKRMLDKARGDDPDCKFGLIPFSRYEVYQELLRRI